MAESVDTAKETGIPIPEYQVRKNVNGHLQLEIDGKQSICPYAGAIATQTPQGQLGFIRQSCSTGCVMVEIKLTDEGCEYITSCGCEKRSIKCTLARVERAQAPVLTIQ